MYDLFYHIYYLLIQDNLTMLKDMSYLLLFFNAGVVALMAIYVYENEKEMAVNSGRHDITAIAAMFVVALMIMYVFMNERKMQQIQTQSDRTGIEQNLQTLNTEKDSMKGSICSLQQDVSKLGLENTTLSQNLSTINQKFEGIEQKLLTLNTEKDIMKGNISSLQQDVSRLGPVNTTLSQNLSTINQKFEGPIMFSAYLSTTIANPHANEVIIFDKTWTNIYTTYNTESGIFTAPISGYYMLSITIASSIVNTHVHLVCNGTAVAYLIADIHHVHHFGRGSLTLIHPLKAGDNIWVKSTDNRANNKILGITPPLTIFTGLLLQKE